MSHVVIVSAVYPPEPLVSARIGLDLATYLSENGNAVTVLCPYPSRPLSTDYSAYRNPDKPSITLENGIEVVRLPSFTAPHASFFARVRESFSFGRHVCRYLVGEPQKPDVLYVNAWPLIAQAQIAKFIIKNRIPMVLQIMDIYPESFLNKIPVFLGMFIVRPLTYLDRWIARQATLISVISENMRCTYVNERGIDEAKVVTINLWQDESLFQHLPDKEEICYKYRIPSNRLTFLYLGNIGPVAGVDFLIKAFHVARLNSAQLLIIGDGSRKAECQELVKQLHAENVFFISDPNVSNIPLLQSMADVCLLPMKHGAGNSSIPSKLPAYMLSKKPILATIDIDSDTANVIREGKCGWVGPPEDQKWLSEKMKAIDTMKSDELVTLGTNGRKFAITHFSKVQGVKRLADMVTSSVGNFRSMP